MQSTVLSAPRQRTCTVDVRAEDPPTRPEHTSAEPQTRRGAPLGYRFDPLPQAVTELIRDGALRPIDAQVLAVLLRFRRRLKHSCWCAKATVAEKLGRSPRTVQRSLRRLGQAGLIEQVPVPAPDPDEPANRTGWRIVFLGMAPDEYRPGPGPIRAGRGVEEGPRRETILSPPPAVSPETLVSPPPETLVSPKECAGASKSDGPELDGETPPSSSSLRAGADPPPAEAPGSDDDDDPTPPRDGERGTTPGCAEAVAIATEHFDAATAEAIRADAGWIGWAIGGRWDCLCAALFLVRMLMVRASGMRRIDKPIRYAVTTARQYAAAGVIPEEARAAERWVKRRAAERAAHEAKRAAAPVPPAAGPEPPPSAADLEQFRHWAAGPDPVLARLGRHALAQTGAAPAAPGATPRPPGAAPIGPGPPPAAPVLGDRPAGDRVAAADPPDPAKIEARRVLLGRRLAAVKEAWR